MTHDLDPETPIRLQKFYSDFAFLSVNHYSLNLSFFSSIHQKINPAIAKDCGSRSSRCVGMG
jgi:hypothetical protein